MKKSKISNNFFIQLTIGLYFAVTGLLGLMGYDSGVSGALNNLNKAVGNKPDYFPLILSICFILCGAVLIIGLVTIIRNPLIYLAVFVLWVMYIIMILFTDNFMEPDFLPWFKDLSLQLIILAGLWTAVKKR